MSTHDEILTLFTIAGRSPSGRYWVRPVKSYGRNWGNPEFENCKTLLGPYKAKDEDAAREKARKAYYKYC